MFKLACDTSSVQCLHQTGLLHILQELGETICIPPAVGKELEEGRRKGVDLPDWNQIPWIQLAHPEGEKDTRLLGDMGPGEAEVMMLALEEGGFVAVLDDAVARRRAALLEIPFTGTLGILLDAKRKGLIHKIKPVLDQLHSLQFHLAESTRNMILRKAGESTHT